MTHPTAKLTHQYRPRYFEPTYVGVSRLMLCGKCHPAPHRSTHLAVAIQQTRLYAGMNRSSGLGSVRSNENLAENI